MNTPPIKVHFQANYLPADKVFKVQVKAPNVKRIVERMSIAKYIRFARGLKDPKTPMVIGGITVTESDGDALQVIRDYFIKVADCYMEVAWGKPRSN